MLRCRSIQRPRIKIKMPLKEEIVIFLAGFIMAFSPGKLGEFIKSTLMKKKYNLNYSETLPVIICERITELLSLILILLFGLIYFEFDIIYIMIAILCTVIPIVLISRTVLFNKLIQKLSKYSYFNARISNLEHFKDSLRLLLGRKIMLISTFLSLVAWIFEFLGFYVIILGFEDTISFLLTCFIYSSSNYS